jgi:hypothetical protein
MRSSPTSITDDGVYPEFCGRAATDEQCFQSFRRAPVYIRTLEHVSPEQGALYLEAIRKIAPNLLADMDEICLNDKIGGPLTVEYGDVGTVSPTTLRYLKVLADLQFMFGPLDGMRICEIGVGYGGQCRLINSFHKVELYRLVDLPSALLLSKRYLDHFDIAPSLEFTRPNDLVPDDYDLVISNYAFTELRQDVQDFYLDNILRRSTRGYVTGNQITPESFNSLSPKEIRDAITSSEIIPEVPKTHPKNYILVWGTDAAQKLADLLEATAQQSLFSRLLNKWRSQIKAVRRFFGRRQ